MDWIKLYTRKWLWGSGRVMTPEKRGVWIDLLALAAEAKLRDGTLRFDVGQPMSRAWIANTLMIEHETLDACLAAFQADINADDGLPRVSIWEDGTIVLNNFERYQEVPDGKKRLTGRELELYKRQRLNRDAAQYPVEAANVPEVKAIIEGELNDKDTT